MLILTEKPSVAKDFASALNCFYSPKEKCYINGDGKIKITNCVGHLFNLAEPAVYNPDFKSWKKLPVIPENFIYEINPKVKDTAKLVISLIKKNKNDGILIATDADREGEIIARECLVQANVSDFSKIRRFWVSEALTKEVILEGIKNAKTLTEFDMLSKQGFARQKADWLIGMNGTRFITNKAKTVMPVGRVQTAVLSEIAKRCNEINDFKSEKYYEFQGCFENSNGKKVIYGTYQKNDNSRFSDKNCLKELNSCIGTTVVIKDSKTEKRNLNPPQLYNLNDLQKDAFNYFDYSAEKTLSIIQKLYETYKCVSYPRTPSKVMGSDNVELCRQLFNKFITTNPEYFELHSKAKIDSENKHIFDNSKLEAHHAIIPLDKLPPNATGDEENIYYLILERFMLAFAPSFEYETMTIVFSASGNDFIVKGKHILEPGWKKYQRFTKNLKETKEDVVQELTDINCSGLVLKNITALEKTTKPPKHYNEALLLSFMENPKGSDNTRLSGIGTAATRHTFIPKLKRLKFIKEMGKNLIVTTEGITLLKLIESTQFRKIADVSETTRWENELNDNPDNFLEEIKQFVRTSTGGKE